MVCRMSGNFMQAETSWRGSGGEGQNIFSKHVFSADIFGGVR